ncbi:hypothetical protein ABPG74_007699 [Tetrahymena malaccensis]
MQDFSENEFEQIQNSPIECLSSSSCQESENELDSIKSNENTSYDSLSDDSIKDNSEEQIYKDKNNEIKLTELLPPQSMQQQQTTLKSQISITYEQKSQKAKIRKILNSQNNIEFLSDQIAQNELSFTTEIAQQGIGRKLIITQEVGIADFFQIKENMKAFRNLYHNADEQIQMFLQSSYCQLNNKLNQMHKQKIVHGDIKPQNIVLSQDSSCFFIDFDESILHEEKNIPTNFHSNHLKHKTSLYNSQNLIDIIQKNEKRHFFEKFNVLRMIDKMQLHLTFIYLFCQSEPFLEFFKQKQMQNILDNITLKYDDDQQLNEIDSSQLQPIEIKNDYEQLKQNIHNNDQSDNSNSNQHYKQFILVDEQMPLTKSSYEFLKQLIEQYEIYEDILLKEFKKKESNFQNIESCLQDNERFNQIQCFNQENLFSQFINGQKINPKQNEEIEYISLNRISAFILNSAEYKFTFNDNLAINQVINLSILKQLNWKLKKFCQDKFENKQENGQNSILFYVYRQQFQKIKKHIYYLNDNLELNNFVQALFLSPKMRKLQINVSKQYQMDSSLIKKMLQIVQQLPNLKSLKLYLVCQNINNLIDDIIILYKKLENFKIEVSKISQINNLNINGITACPLKRLNISLFSSNICDNQLINIVNPLQYSQLEEIKLDLTNCQSITDESVSQIFSILKSIRQLKKINLNLQLCNNLAQQSINSLLNFLKQNKSVNLDIDFTDCSNISHSSFDELFNYFSFRSTIKYTLCIKYRFLTGNNYFKIKSQEITNKFKEITFKNKVFSNSQYKSKQAYN